ncbi:MAG: hypothetical protein CVU71_13835 [Deltaproteobacteria bacterium HGW-Deltaproteobacteria-6]|jgi:uncharacterized protein (DUF849 family)|nr:MAG: hypothetical protein CVU71_13835 [Deltaproteobacteria bacterium HGW-Deltaproteobacteria-6]
MRKSILLLAGFLTVLLWPFPASALTPEQVIELKKEGVSEATIQRMIEQQAREKDPYATMGVKEVKDKDGNTVIIHSTGGNTGSTADDEEAAKVDKAWEMLRNMTIKHKR